MTDPQSALEFDKVLLLTQSLGPLATFACVDDDGTPHVVPVIPVWSQEMMVFATRAGSRKHRNLQQRQRVSLQYLTPGEMFPEALLIKGVARVVDDDAERSAYWDSGAMPWLATMYPGPTDPALRFVEVTPTSALVVRNGGRGPVERWRRPAASQTSAVNGVASAVAGS